MAFYGYPYGYGFNPYLSVPIIQNDYKIGGLLNEYAELNDLSAKNNATYLQNMANDCKSCKRDVNSSDYTPPPETRRIGYPGYNPGYYPGYNAGFYNPGYYPGYNPGYNLGYNPGFYSGYNPLITYPGLYTTLLR